MYTEPDDAVDGQDEEIERIRGGARKSEEQVMFGKWPWRLLKWQVRKNSFLAIFYFCFDAT